MLLIVTEVEAMAFNWVHSDIDSTIAAFPKGLS